MNFSDAIRLSFQADYPHGSQLHFKSENEPLGYPTPHYIHFILKGMERGLKKPLITCVVFPKKGFAAHAAWTALAIDTLARRVLPEKIQKSSELNLSELQVNDLVSTYPGDKVFIWGGEMTNDGKQYLSFKVIGKKSDQVCIPISTFSPLRVKKYPGTNPPPRQIGKLSDLNAEPPASGLDLLMPSKSYGNKGLVGVCACLISDKSTVGEFKSQAQIGLFQEGPFTTIEDSILHKDVQAQSPEECTCLYSSNLADALEMLRTTKDLPLGLKTPLIIDGLSHIRDYSHIRDLRFPNSDEQRPIVVVAEYSERSHIERLKETFDFWELHNTEIQSR